MNILDWVRRSAELIAAEAERLSRLDAAIGDGDHGHNLDRGFAAAVEALPEHATPGRALVVAGRTIVSTTGGVSGPLYGMAVRRAGKELGDAVEVDAVRLGAALRGALETVQELGEAEEGEKTMVDALAPAVAAYERALAAGGDLAECTRAAADAAERGAQATVPMQARKGRASYLGKRSIGHLDPGAVSTALLIRALADLASEDA
ncbi:dihydroxyacetone kinase subunit DhaL [Actinomadura keratinilytica]|uniref:Dihydroxyacetone kinase subunit DhaL n=1 Tax=Actinomadura keratinilytica TaxID=547461 RepID=A0ABP7YZV8_9ACTN